MQFKLLYLFYKANIILLLKPDKEQEKVKLSGHFH